jgi:hypothetical protein
MTAADERRLERSPAARFGDLLAHLRSDSTIRRAQALLVSYEHIWRARIARLDAQLAEDN